MRAVICEGYGPPSNLKLVELPVPNPGPDDVLVEVEAVGLGFVDALVVRGDYQVKAPLPFTPGSEIAGRITKVGANVAPSRVGEAVVAVGHSALAEFVSLRSDICVRRPDGFSAEAAAGALISYCTNIYAFEDCARLQPGETLLVLGASGGVGGAAIDLGKALGARVIAAASSAEKRAAALERGADAVIDYTVLNWREALKAILPATGLDVVYDPVGGVWSETAFRSLSPGGRHLVVGFASGEIPKLPLNLPLLKRAQLIGVDWGGHVRADPTNNAPLMRRLFELHAAGLIAPEPSSSYTLDDVPVALCALLERRTIGKPVVKVRK